VRFNAQRERGAEDGRTAFLAYPDAKVAAIAVRQLVLGDFA
jgi:hypothetical protein